MICPICKHEMMPFGNPAKYPDFLCVPCDLAVFKVIDFGGTYIEWYWNDVYYSDEMFQRTLKLKAFW
jgi:hypothetical protein